MGYPAGIQNQHLSVTMVELGIKSQQEWKLARDVKGNKKTSDKKSKESVEPCFPPCVGT